MSHHGESPLAQEYPRLDIADVFLFRGEAGTVFVQTLSPMSGPAGFEPDGVYEFNIDASGRGLREAVFRVSFGEPALRELQPLQLRLLTGAAAASRDADGQFLASASTETIIEGRHGVRVWAGRAADPFYINPAVITAVVQTVQTGAPLDVRALAAAEPSNLFGGTNVNAIVLEVPDELLPARIGFWATTARRDAGGWMQVQRCATPLIPTIFFSGEDASRYQATEPAQDRELYGRYVSEVAAAAAARLSAAGDPAAHGRQVADALFPDMLRYEVGTSAQFGFAARNGRSLTEPVAEVMCALVTGRAIPLGLDSSTASGTLSRSFPYLAAPVPEPALPGTA